MSAQNPLWTEFLSCPICYNVFGETRHRPISLGCGHTICYVCLTKIEQKRCPFDQNPISRDIDELPVNFALLQLVGVAIPDHLDANHAATGLAENYKFYSSAKSCIENLATYLKPEDGPSSSQLSPSSSPGLSRPMQRKLVTLVNSQLLEEEGRARAMRAARSLGERAVTELILQHQNPQQLSANLWAAVRARGCQFLGPAMQEEVLKLVLLALEDGSALSRKVLVLFAVQRLESQYTQASKTAVGHVVQLLYRASCFKVTKRDEESSLMQLKDEFRTYEALRREHDSQIVQIAIEAGLRISPEQWSSLLYGDAAHKSYMQSIIDKLQTPQSFSQSVSELVLALQRTSDPGGLARLKAHFDLLANIDPSPESPPPSWENLDGIMRSVLTVVEGLIDFFHDRTSGKADPIAQHNTKFKTSMCRDLLQKGRCPRGSTCTFAHSKDEMERFRNQNKKFGVRKAKTSVSEVANPEDDFLAFTASQKQAALYLESQDLDITRSTVVAVPGMSVSVPVGKPSILPIQAKKAVCQQTIYTSPTFALGQLDPPSVPMSKQAPPPNIVYPDGRVTPEVKPTIAVSRSIPVSPRPPPPESPISQILCMPSNPYTRSSPRINLPTVDSHYYLSSNIQAATKGHSPTQQLKELQRRKTELISHLMESENPPVTLALTKTCTDEPGMSEIKVKIPHDVTISKSVADSLATSISTMAMNRAELRHVRNNPVEIRRTLYNSLSKSAPPSRSHANAHRDLIRTTHTVQVSSFSHVPAPHTRTIQVNEQLSPMTETSSTYTASATAPPTHPSSSHNKVNPNTRQELASWEYPLWFSEDDDEFIPFEHTVVSKYGPISRTAKAKVQNTYPVQVQAMQAKDTTPVNTVTPMNNRPYPMANQVPSRFPAPSNPSEGEAGVLGQVRQKASPEGLYMATSLPTALIQPNVVTAGAAVQRNSLRKHRERALTLPSAKVEMVGVPGRGSEDMCTEIAMLNTKISNLKQCEDVRLARELQAVELNIQEAHRQIMVAGRGDDVPGGDYVQDGCSSTVKQVAEQKRVQEELDRKLAEKMVIEEARQMFH